MDTAIFNTFLVVMAVTALLVFIALHFINAGYGMLFDKKWGASLSNRIGWIVMEAPVFIAMIFLWIFATDEYRFDPIRITFLVLFQIHYFQRSFIFPFLIKGNSRMPLSIVSMGIIFNLLNALMQGGWIFYISPLDYYTAEWFYSPQFIIGVIIFFAGMFINIQSDSIIRHLRKPGDRRHYIPQGGMFRMGIVGKLFWRMARMGRIRYPHLVMGRSRIRLVDIRQPCPPVGSSLQAIQRRVRRRIYKRKTEKNNTLHLLTTWITNIHKNSPYCSHRLR